jgi:hypothetical protein
VSEQSGRGEKNPPDQLRRVYDIFIQMHTTFTSPGSPDENDDVMMICSTYLNNLNAKIVKN